MADIEQNSHFKQAQRINLIDKLNLYIINVSLKKSVCLTINSWNGQIHEKFKVVHFDTGIWINIINKIWLWITINVRTSASSNKASSKVIWKPRNLQQQVLNRYLRWILNRTLRLQLYFKFSILLLNQTSIHFKDFSTS